jgi:hypothetical protein
MLTILFFVGCFLWGVHYLVKDAQKNDELNSNYIDNEKDKSIYP